MKKTDLIVSHQFESLGNIRTVTRDGEPWFIAQDICKILGIEDASQAMVALDSDEKVTVDLRVTPFLTGGITVTNIGQEKRGNLSKVWVISESGLYTIILRSREATTQGSVAHRFKRWVTKEVLPSIRRTGSYRQSELHQKQGETKSLQHQTLEEWVGKLGDDVRDIAESYVARKNEEGFKLVKVVENGRIYYDMVPATRH